MTMKKNDVSSDRSVDGGSLPNLRPAREDPGYRSGLASELELRQNLDDLKQQDLRILSGYARYQLAHSRMPLQQADDMVQHAVEAVLSGIADTSKGRHPKVSDLGANFLGYLKSVIRSVIEAQRSRAENRFNHTSWEDDLADQIACGAGADHEIVFRDLSEVLAGRLAERVPTRLQALLEAWREQRFDCDLIPLAGKHRRLRIELRTAAAEVLRELSFDGRSKR